MTSIIHCRLVVILRSRNICWQAYLGCITPSNYGPLPQAEIQVGLPPLSTIHKPVVFQTQISQDILRCTQPAHIYM
jgi:hypothetical protein